MEDKRLYEAFLDGVAKGVLYTLAGLFFAIIILLVVFFSPESKTKMICEPSAKMIHANI